MAADSPAELQLKKLLLHNKLITQRQVDRVVETSAGRSKRTLPDEILHRRLVKPDLMLKIVDSIRKKGLVFPPLAEDVDGTIESGPKAKDAAMATEPAKPAPPAGKSGGFPVVGPSGTKIVDTAKPAVPTSKSGVFPAVKSPGTKVVDTAKPAVPAGKNGVSPAVTAPGATKPANGAGGAAQAAQKHG